MPVIELPDGTEAEFPDEMPAEQIRAVLAKQFPAPAAKKEAPGVLETAADMAGKGATLGLGGHVRAALGAALDPLFTPYHEAKDAADYFGHLGDRYRQNLAEEEGRFKAEREAHPYLAPAAEGLGTAAAAAVAAPFKVASDAGRLTKALTNARNMAALGMGSRAVRGVVEGEDVPRALAEGAKTGGLDAALGLSTSGAVEGGAALAKKAAPVLRRAAGSLKAQSLRPTPTLAEAMEELPGGKAGVGEALLRRNVGALTKKGTADQIAQQVTAEGQNIGNAISEADRPTEAPNLFHGPAGDIATSGQGIPSEIDAVADRLRADLEAAGKLPPAVEGTVGGRPSTVLRPGGTSPGGPAARAPDIADILADARTNVVRPVAAEPFTRQAGEAADDILSEYEAMNRSNPASFKVAHDFKKKLGDEIYGAGEEFKKAGVKLKGDYAKTLNKVYGQVENAIQDKMEGLSPDLAESYRGANLDYRRLVHAKAAADRLAGRATSNHGINLMDLAAGGLSAHGGDPGLDAIISGLKGAAASALYRNYGTQLGARALYGLGGALGKGAPEALTPMLSGGVLRLSPEIEQQLIQAQLLKAARNETQEPDMLARRNE